MRVKLFPRADQDNCLSFLRELGHWKEGEVVGMGINIDPIKDCIERAIGTRYAVGKLNF